MDIQRPTYLIDPDKIRANIRKMADKADRNRLIFRPHFKTHQSRVIGGWFREEGVDRITVSSLTMASYFAADGWTDITVAFPVNLHEIDTINRLASTITLGLLTEDAGVAENLARQLQSPADLYIKIDCGYHRTGLEPSEIEEIRRIAAIATHSPMLRLRGLLTHAGHTYEAKDPAEVIRIGRSSLAVMDALRRNLHEYPDLIVSYGDTPSCSLLETFPGADEIRPGNFVLYDLMQENLGSCTFPEVAGIVVCPVVAVHPGRNQAVLYGGAIHFSKDRLIHKGRYVYGRMVEWAEDRWLETGEDAWIVSLSQEHGILEAPASRIQSLKPGSLVGIQPVHSCLTANLLRQFITLDGQRVDHMEGI